MGETVPMGTMAGKVEDVKGVTQVTSLIDKAKHLNEIHSAPKSVNAVGKMGPIGPICSKQSAARRLILAALN